MTNNCNGLEKDYTQLSMASDELTKQNETLSAKLAKIKELVN